MTDLRPLDAPPADGTQTDPTETESAQSGTTQTAKEEAAQVASTAAKQGKQTVSAAAQAATQTSGTAAEGAKQVASEAAQQVTEVTRQASDQARELVGQAQTQLREQAASQTQRAAVGLSDVGRQIRALGEGQPDEAGFAADGARQIADKIEELAGRLEQRGFDGAVEDLRDFARRRPGMFLLSAAATGFVVGRLGRGMQVAQQPPGAAPGLAGLTGTTAPTLGAVSQPTPLLPPPAALGTPEPYLPEPSLPGIDGGV